MKIEELSDSLAAEGETLKEGWVMNKILDMLPERLHHFRTVWDNISRTERTMSNLFESLRLEDDRQASDGKGNSSQQTAFVAKQNKLEKVKPTSQSNVECYKCGKKGHIKAKCKGKPTEKYLEYCKNKYGCKICHNKGHFANECPNKDVSHSEKYSKENKSRAFITIGLSAANVDYVRTDKEYSASWYQDSGATQHMSSHVEWMCNYKKLDQPTMVVLGDGSTKPGIGVGDIELEAFDSKSWQRIVLRNVLHVPTFPFNLFSVITALDKGYIQSGDAEKSIFRDKVTHEIVATADRRDNLFRMNFRAIKSENCLITVTLKQWHEKMAHQNIKHVKDILNRKGVKFEDDWNDYVCPGCAFGKQHRISHPINEKVASQPLDLVHVDLCEMNIHSLGGAKYYLLFKDDYSHYKTVYFLKNKSEAVSKLDIFLKLVENQFGRKVKCLRSDWGTEICNKEAQSIIESLGILHTKSTAYTPQQNGRIEREIRTVTEAARSIIHAKGMNENLWAEAVNYSVFTLNQSGTSSVKDKTPAELWFGRIVSVDKLKTFGCKCYVFIQDRFRSKTEKKSKTGLFVGYDTDAPSYRILLDENRSIVSSNDVIFDEQFKSTESFTQFETSLRNDVGSNTKRKESESEKTSDQDDQSSKYESLESEESDMESSESEEDELPYRALRNRRNLKIPVKYNDYELSKGMEKKKQETALIGAIEDISVSEAMKDERYKEAMLKEFDALMSMQTWTLVDPPDYVTPLEGRWLLREKEDGIIKARYVVKGCQQREGIDYSDTYSPVVDLASIRLLLSIAASRGMEIITFDVISAFLNGELEEVIHMKQPEGFDDGSGRICKLNKSLYGLKQSPKNWNQAITALLKSLNFESTDDDPCVYYNPDKSIIIALHVDDGMMIGKSVEEMIKVLEQINKKYKLTYKISSEKGLSYLGMKIEVRSNEIFISQPNYARKILTRFSYENVNSAPTPIEKGMVTEEADFVNNKPLSKSVPYRAAIGSLLYLAVTSRPDISFAVSYLSRFNSNPKASHWCMVKRVFQYVKGTIEFGISFNGGKELIAYTDSDYAGDSETSKSTTGVLLIRGGPIAWFSQKQRLVVNSTAEAEYRAAVSCIDEVCLIRRIASELDCLDMSKPTPLLIDNNSAIFMLKSAHEGKRQKGKKHVEISRKFIQQHIDVTVSPKHVRSSDQLSDILTKPLQKKMFQMLRRKIIKEEC